MKPILIAAFLVLTSIAPSKAVILFRVDDFQDGTIENWSNGVAAEPLNVPNNGPLGAGDAYMRVVADGSGSGGRLTVFNLDQWTGDYHAAGVTAIEMDLKNPGTNPLTIRIAFKTDRFGGAPGYSYTEGFIIPADNIWRHFVFELDGSLFTAIGGPQISFDELLFDAPELRILHSAAPSLNGDPINNNLGVDNVRAIPEPRTFLLVAACAGVLRRRRQSRR
jgi:hypothetical protein